MFTGIVTDIGEVLAVEPREGLHRLTIGCRFERASVIDGASIACSGVCLTVVAAGVENGRTWFAVDAAAEILDALALQVGILLERGVQIIDVRLMVLPVVDLHRLRVAVGLERARGVG